MNGWLAALRSALQRHGSVVRVTVASIKGSAPREPGACMLVGPDTWTGSIGGGHLELKAIEIARGMLARPDTGRSRLDRFALGATLGQCCGGAVNLWFDRSGSEDLPFVDAAISAGERGPTVIASELGTGAVLRRHVHARAPSPALDAAADDPALAEAIERLLDAPSGGARARLLPAAAGRPATLLERADSGHAPLWLFGAGHVGRALVGVLADLPFDVVWIDSRADMFPAVVPLNALMRCDPDPVAAARQAPPGAWFLVMTHSHDLDYDLCATLLRRDDHAWAGLIGSETKAACFNVRFAREGIAPQAVARLACPIGNRSIRSKLPGAIAVSIAAQLLEVFEARAAAAPSARAQRAAASGA